MKPQSHSQYTNQLNQLSRLNHAQNHSHNNNPAKRITMKLISQKLEQKRSPKLKKRQKKDLITSTQRFKLRERILRFQLLFI
jgi:hypothetical protein